MSNNKDYFFSQKPARNSRVMFEVVMTTLGGRSKKEAYSIYDGATAEKRHVCKNPRTTLTTEEVANLAAKSSKKLEKLLRNNTWYDICYSLEKNKLF